MKKNRTVKRKEEFTEIIQTRKFSSDKNLTLYYRAKKEDNSRIGISVTKKLGNAVARNKAKRQVREMIKVIFTADENFDCIIVIRPSFKDSSYDDNKKGLERCYKRVKI